MSESIIPFGYRRITGQLQKGDGVWDGERFRKVKKEYPHSDGHPGFLFAIRKCEVIQEALPLTKRVDKSL